MNFNTILNFKEIIDFKLNSILDNYITYFDCPNHYLYNGNLLDVQPEKVREILNYYNIHDDRIDDYLMSDLIRDYEYEHRYIPK